MNIPTNFLETFKCPLSGMIMTDPVIIEDGYSYERHVILTWFKSNNYSPITCKRVDVHNVIPNITLKKIISRTNYSPETPDAPTGHVTPDIFDTDSVSGRYFWDDHHTPSECEVNHSANTVNKRKNTKVNFSFSEM
jgi:hypothetical protein